MQRRQLCRTCGMKKGAADDRAHQVDALLLILECVSDQFFDRPNNT